MVDHAIQAGLAADADPALDGPNSNALTALGDDVGDEGDEIDEIDEGDVGDVGDIGDAGDEGNAALAALVERVLRPRAVRAAAGEVGRQVLHRMGGLAGLARSSSVELAHCRGVGPAGADRLRAAIELGRRVASRTPVHGVAFGAPEDVDRYLRPLVRDLEVERFHVFCLDARHRLRRAQVVSVGTLTASLVHPREVFRVAVREAAAAILLAHNHPSGDPTPSAEDAAVTRRLADVGRVLGIRVLDHVIVAAGGYYSFRESGRLEPVRGQGPKEA